MLFGGVVFRILVPISAAAGAGAGGELVNAATVAVLVEGEVSFSLFEEAGAVGEGVEEVPQEGRLRGEVEREQGVVDAAVGEEGGRRAAGEGEHAEQIRGREGGGVRRRS